jgi:hypothetical protein
MINERKLKQVLLEILDLVGTEVVYTECTTDYGPAIGDEEGDYCSECKDKWDCREQYKKMNQTKKIIGMIEQIDEPEEWI